MPADLYHPRVLDHPSVVDPALHEKPGARRVPMITEALAYVGAALAAAAVIAVAIGLARRSTGEGRR